jgi:hypothetical protein
VTDKCANCHRTLHEDDKVSVMCIYPNLKRIDSSTSTDSFSCFLFSFFNILNPASPQPGSWEHSSWPLSPCGSDLGKEDVQSANLALCDLRSVCV